MPINGEAVAIAEKLLRNLERKEDADNALLVRELHHFVAHHTKPGNDAHAACTQSAHQAQAKTRTFLTHLAINSL